MAKKQPKNISYKKRLFLDKEGLEAIECKVESWDFSYGIDAVINIQDSNRAVHLEFCAYSSKDLDKAVDKLLKFQEQINNMVTFYADNYETMLEYMKAKELERKENTKKYSRKSFTELVKELDDADTAE